MRFLLFVTYYFASPFIAALLAQTVLPDFPEVDENTVLAWTFIVVASIPALLLVTIYTGIEAKKRFAHPLSRLHYRSTRRPLAPSSSPANRKKPSERISQIN